MSRYLIRRVLLAIPTLLLISFVLFAILSLAPGDPLSQFAANPAVPPEVRENIRRSLGLDQPWPIRYVKWVIALAHGDWGFSFGSRMPVWDLLKLRIPSTLAVVGVAYVVVARDRDSDWHHLRGQAVFAVRPRRHDLRLHRLFRADVFHGLMLIILFSVKLQWLPFIYDSTLQVRDLSTLGTQIPQSIMPITVLALFQTATLVRFTRASLLENLPQDYVRTARAKGVAEFSVINRHAVRNSLIPGGDVDRPVRPPCSRAR